MGRPAFVLAIAVLTTVLVYVNVAVGVYYQRLVTLDVGRADFVGFQQDLDRRLFGDAPPVATSQGREFPPVEDTTIGDLQIVGDCQGLYIAGITFNTPYAWQIWGPVERTPATGAFRLRMDLAALPPTDGPVPIAVSGPAGDRTVVTFERLSGDRGRFGLGTENWDDWMAADPFTLPDGPAVYEVTLDRRVLIARVDLEDRLLMVSYFWRPVPDETIEIGRGADSMPEVRAEFPGEIESLPLTTPVCDELLSRLERTS